MKLTRKCEKCTPESEDSIPEYQCDICHKLLCSYHRTRVALPLGIEIDACSMDCSRIASNEEARINRAADHWTMSAREAFIGILQEYRRDEDD